MRAVIMAGGRGERLRPLTDTCPKPLLPVGGRPVLDRLLEKLSEAGIQDVTLAVGYLGQLIEAYVGDGARWGVRADYVRQVEPMGTAGALSLLADKSESVLVVNGDKVIEHADDLGLIMAWESKRDVTAVGVLAERVPYGVVRNGYIEEKPEHYAVAGVYVVSPPTLARVHAPMDMPQLAISCFAIPFRGYVLDIGTPATYEAANARLSSR